MLTTLTPTEQVLLRLARVSVPQDQLQAIQDEAPQIDFQALLVLSRRGGLTGLVGRNLEKLDLDRQVKLDFARTALLVQHKNQIMIGQAKELCSEAARRELTLIPLKGAALNIGPPYDDLGLRDMCDLDLLTPMPQIADVEAILLDLGYVDTTQRTYALRHSHHLHYERQIGGIRVHVELHWSPMSSVYVDPQLETEMVERSRLCEIDGQSLRMFHPDDMMLSLIVHLAAHRFRAQLKWLVDLAELTRWPGEALHWDRIFARTRRLGAERATVHALWLARHLLDAPVPLPDRLPLLLPLIRRATSIPAIVTSQPQPSWSRRAVISFLEHDRPWHGLDRLLRKGKELYDRYVGLRDRPT